MKNKNLLKIKYSKSYKSSNEIVSQYNKYGWVNIKNAFSKIEMKKIEHDLDNLSKSFFNLKFQEAIIKLHKKDKDKLYKLCTTAGKITSHLMLIKKFDDICKKIFKSKTSINLGQFILPGPPKDKRLVYNFHQENNFYLDHKDTLHFHFPLYNNANLENGSMSALSKTHKINRIKKNHFIKKKKGFLSIIPKNIDKLIYSYEHVIFELKIRDLLIFDGNLIHKSNPNKSKKCRVVGITRLAPKY